MPASYQPSEDQACHLYRSFTYHPPQSDQIPRYEQIRSGGRNLAELLIRLCPDSRELTFALSRIEEAVMWANAAIARNE